MKRKKKDLSLAEFVNHQNRRVEEATKMEVIVDRFEGDFAVCEKANGEMIDIPREKLPEKVRAGDVLVISDGQIQIDAEKRKEREVRIQHLLDELWD